MKKAKITHLLVLLFVFFVSCSKVPITNRKQVKLLPESMLLNMSLTSYQDFLKTNPPAPATDKNTLLLRRNIYFL